MLLLKIQSFQNVGVPAMADYPGQQQNQAGKIVHIPALENIQQSLTDNKPNTTSKQVALTEWKNVNAKNMAGIITNV